MWPPRAGAHPPHLQPGGSPAAEVAGGEGGEEEDQGIQKEGGFYRMKDSMTNKFDEAKSYMSGVKKKKHKYF